MTGLDGCRVGEHEWLPGAPGMDVCKRCGLRRELTAEGVSYATPLPRVLMALDSHEPVGDARAQLWARVYAAQFEVCMHRPSYHETGARWDAVQTADAAVRDFDEHYLGGKR